MLKRPLFFMITAVTILLGITGMIPHSAADLPKRPTPTPTPVPRIIDGAKIQLQPSARPLGAVWTWVEWQDADGEWHQVDGWQGELDADDQKTWWVGADHLGTGPFRWLLAVDDQRPFVSAPFNLPTLPGETLVVPLAVE